MITTKMWQSLLKLMGVKLKMSSLYHPELDGASEGSGRAINQSVRYHIRHNQKGWVCALPCIRFMNTVNASTGFSGFQLKLGRSPCVIPPLVPSDLPDELRNTPEAAVELAVADRVNTDVTKAGDNLLAAKVAQAHSTNSSCGKEVIYEFNDLVMLSTFNCRHDYKRKGEKCVAKVIP